MRVASILSAGVVGLILFFLAFPIVVVAIASFSSATYLTFPPPAFGLRWYEAYFGNPDWLKPTWVSIWVACAVVVLATFLGTLAALGIARLPKGLRVVAAGLILSPLIVPGHRRGDRHLLRLFALRPGRHAHRDGAGAHLPRRALRRHQCDGEPVGHRPADWNRPRSASARRQAPPSSR